MKSTCKTPPLRDLFFTYKRITETLIIKRSQKKLPKSRSKFINYKATVLNEIGVKKNISHTIRV